MLAGKQELDIFTNQDAESILKRTNRHTTLLDTLCWDFITLAARYQPKEDVPQNKPRVGSLVIFHRGEKPFHKSISRNALGIIIGFSPPSHVDNVVRGVFIRGHQNQDLEKQKKRKQQIGKYRFFNYHRSLTDVIIIENKSLLEQNQRFKKDTPEYWKESLDKIQEDSDDDIEDSKDDTENNTDDADDGTGDEAEDGTGDEAEDGTDDEAEDGTDDEAKDGTDSEVEEAKGKVEEGEPRSLRRSSRIRNKTSLAALLILSRADLAQAQMLKEDGEGSIGVSVWLTISFIILICLISILSFRWRIPTTGIPSASNINSSKEYRCHTPHTRHHNTFVKPNTKMFFNYRLN